MGSPGPQGKKLPLTSVNGTLSSTVTSFTPPNTPNTFCYISVSANGTINPVPGVPTVGSRIRMLFNSSLDGAVITFDASYGLTGTLTLYQGTPYYTLSLVWTGSAWAKSNERIIRYESPVTHAASFTPSFAGADDLVYQCVFNTTAGTLGLANPTDGWHSGAFLFLSLGSQAAGGTTITFDSLYGIAPITIPEFGEVRMALIRNANGAWYPIYMDPQGPNVLTVVSGTTYQNTVGPPVFLDIQATFNANTAAGTLSVAMGQFSGSLTTLVTATQPVGSVNGIVMPLHVRIPATYYWSITWNASVTGVTVNQSYGG